MKKLTSTPKVKSVEGMLTIREAIELTGVSRVTLDKWLNEGKFSSVKKLNRQRLIDKASLESFIKERLESFGNG